MEMLSSTFVSKPSGDVLGEEARKHDENPCLWMMNMGIRDRTLEKGEIKVSKPPLSPKSNHIPY